MFDFRWEFTFVDVKKGDGETIIEEDYLGLKDLKRFFALYQAEEFKELLIFAGFMIVHESQHSGRTHRWLHFLAKKTRTKFQSGSED